MSDSRFDVVIHAPNRLQICAALVALKELEFKLLQERLEVSDSVLSKHIKVLQGASYVIVSKRVESGRQRTWVSLSKQGRKAFKEHVKLLKEIVA